MSAAQGKTIVIDLDGRTARMSGKDDLYQGDSYANDIVVEFVRSGAPAQISGYTASGEFERSDGVKVPCTGTLSGNVATIRLDEHCYYRDGVYRLTVRLSKSNEDITRTVLEITGTVQSRSDGPTVDIDETLVNVDKVLELYDEMKDATKNVQSATDAANDAAAAAQQATTQANTAANSANVAAGSVNSSISQAASAATNANNAAQTANTAAANADMQANSAADAAIRALAAAAKPPLVDPQSKTWRIWDDANQTYKATQYPAQGPKGDKGDKGDAAQVTAANIQNALGYVPADPANVTVSADKIKEALGYTPANDASTEQIFSELDKLENNKLDNRGLPYNRVVATDYQGSIQFLNFTEVGEDVTATKIQQALGYIPLKEITAEGIETALGYEPADKVATDALFEDKLGLWNNTPNKYVVTDSAGSIRFADPPAGGGSGGGVPPTGPYQMLVTDGDQSQVWEERTHYPYIGLVEILPEVEYKNIEYEPGTISQNITAYMKGPIVAGKTYYITFGDERLECLAYVDGPGMTVIAENNDFINARVAVIYYSDGKCLLSVNDGDANPNPIVKVEGPGVKYKKLDPAKYLPEGGVGWTEEGGGGVIVETSWEEAMVEQMGGQMFVLTPPSMPLVAGEDYTFTINGVEYETTAEALTIEGATSVCAGNVPAIMETGDNGLPFVYVDASTTPDMAAEGMYGLLMLFVETSWPCTLKIEGGGEIIHKIDEKYLPKIDTAKMLYVDSTTLTGNAGGKLTVYKDAALSVPMAYAEGLELVQGGNQICNIAQHNDVYNNNDARFGVLICYPNHYGKWLDITSWLGAHEKSANGGDFDIRSLRLEFSDTVRFDD